MKLDKQFFASSWRITCSSSPPFHLPQWREENRQGKASDPIVQRPENAVFRQIARVRCLPIGSRLGVKTAAAQLLRTARGPSAEREAGRPKKYPDSMTLRALDCGEVTGYSTTSLVVRSQRRQGKASQTRAGSQSGCQCCFVVWEYGLVVN
jgi:hypothetical protein